MALTAAGIRGLKAGEKPYKRFDERGLFLLVNPSRDPSTPQQPGSLLWRMKYRINGKEKVLALGHYPEVSLKEARDRRDKARQLLRDHIDPSAKRKAEKQAEGETFVAIAKEWIAAGCPGGRSKGTRVSPKTANQLQRRLERYAYPALGSLQVGEITPTDLLALLRKIEDQGLGETAHRVRAVCSRVFKYAVRTGRANSDPAGELVGTLAPAGTKHFAAVTKPQEVGQLLRAIDAYHGSPITIAALKLLALTFVRPGELRNARWEEFDVDNKTWLIPASRMKMDRDHIVPLSRQAIDILNQVSPITGHRELVFESLRPGRPLSDGTLNMALRAAGFAGDRHVAHGFRSTASTLLHDMQWPHEVIELQLAHQQRDRTSAAYNRSARLQERTRMMQAWADHLDGLRDGADVVAIRNARDSDAS